MHRRLWPSSVLAVCVCASIGFAATAPNLEMSGFSASSGTLSASVVNTNTQAVNTDIVFYRGNPKLQGAVEVARVPLTVPANSTGRATTPAALTNNTVYSACVNTDGALPETNGNDNCATATLSTQSVDLSVSTIDIRFKPVGVNPGEPFEVTAVVKNKSALQAQAVARLYQGKPGTAAAKLIAQVPVTVGANNRAAASWSAIRPAGDPNLWVSVEDVVPRDSSTTDNQAPTNLYIKAIIPKAGTYNSSAVVGDLMGTGQPVLVYSENAAVAGETHRAAIVALQVFSDGTTKELWRKTPSGGNTIASPMTLGDIDGDGSPEIIVEITRNLTVDPNRDSEIQVLALDRNGNTKWSRSWTTPGRVSCFYSRETEEAPALGDLNKDGVADVVLLERELVVLDGRTGGELVRKPGIPNLCSQKANLTVVDLDGDGTNEIVAGEQLNLHVFNADGSVRWSVARGSNWYAIIDIERDGAPEIVVPIHLNGLEIRNAVTGALKRTIAFDAYSEAIGVTTSFRPDNLPTVMAAHNGVRNGTLAIDPVTTQTYWSQTSWAIENFNATDAPSRIVMADLLGLGRPQLITHSTRRYFSIQDSRDGKYLNYMQVYGGSTTAQQPPSVVDVDGDGHGEVVLVFDNSLGDLPQADGETRLPAAAFVIFGSDHWAKIPTTWNRDYFVANQVDRHLAFRHDYQPWKSHNTAMQQPLRAKCDIDFDDDIDKADIAAITSSRGAAISPGDWRDIDGDGAITVADSRACALKCTLPNCTAIDVGGRILSISPMRGVPGTGMRVTVRGEFLDFQQDATTLDFGAGIAVNSLTVLDQNTAVADITVAPALTGGRTVTVATGARQASRVDGFLLSDGNRPPVVRAGGDEHTLAGGTVSLSASVIDDGAPAPAGLAWQVLAGPGPVSFSSPNSAATLANFPVAGFYQLRLTATDGEFSAVDDVGVTVIQGNAAPFVSATANRAIELNNPLTLEGQVLDDGLPTGATVTSQWSMVAGPGTATFTQPSQPSTAVTFSAPGTYVLRLDATDTELSAGSDVTITVNPPLAILDTVGPDSATPGQTRAITLTGKFTNFVNGTTTASFGGGVSVGGAPEGAFGPVQVVNATTAIAQVAVGSAAALGSRAVTVMTGAEQASRAGVFLVGALGVPASIRPNLTDLVVAPDGTITAKPQLVDAGGNVLPSDGVTFQMTVAGKPGASYGNAPVVNGLSVRFPKVARRLVNQDPTLDPDGEFTDGDPSDANYGKETGGLYNLTLTVPNTSLSSSTTVAVLGTGTAALTMRYKEYPRDLENVFAPAADAAARGDAAALTAAKNALSAIRNKLEYDLDLLQWNNVLAPPNGREIELAQVTGRFPASADDAAFGRLLDSMTTAVRNLRASIAALNIDAPVQSQLDAVRTQVNAFTTLQQQLERLHPSPVGVTQNSAKINTYMRLELPLLFDAMAAKGAAILDRATAGQSAPIRSVMSAADFEGVYRAQAAGDTLLTFFSNTFSILTDLAKYEQANVKELVTSLANDIVNMAIAGIVNAMAPPGLGIDAVVASDSPLIACPLHPNTYVEGFGFGSKNTSSVAIIGCIDSYAIRNALTISKPKDLAAAIRLSFKIKSLVDAVGRDQSIAAIEYPDGAGPGVFGPSRLTFSQGWPRVNQGRIPCVGVVIVFNLETGGYQAVNVNVLPQCGG